MSQDAESNADGRIPFHIELVTTDGFVRESLYLAQQADAVTLRHFLSDWLDNTDDEHIDIESITITRRQS